MTTVFDPLGTPTIAYNKAGKVMFDLVANAGSGFGNAVQIPYVSGETTVFVVTGSGGAVYFDAAFEMGDTVEISISGGSLECYDSAGGGHGTFSSNVKFVLRDPLTNYWKRIG